MSKEAIYVKDSLEEVVYAHTAAVSAGEIIVLPTGQVGVAATDIAADADGVYTVKGIVQVIMTTGYLVTQGDKVYWDASASKAVTTTVGLGDPLLGKAETNITALGGYVDVRLGDADATGRTADGLTAAAVLAFAGDHTCVNATLATNNHLETVTNARFISTDRAVCNMISTTDNSNHVLRSKVNDGTLSITLATVNVGGVINYGVIRSV
jgi:predicted RecA/RadA family phage recombinase